MRKHGRGIFFGKGLFAAALAAAILLPLVSAGQPVSQRIGCVVIDAGHGGHDFGCISADKKTAEKSIALDVSLKFGAMIKEAYPDMKVVYTRKKDLFIPLSERADIANRNKADFFISIHVNSAGKSTQPNGTETFTMGTHVNSRNFEVSKRENSVILMEDDYNTKYEGFNPDSPESYIIFSLLQNAYSEQSIEFAELIQKEYVKGPVKYNRGVKQAGFLVLWRTTMPSVLTEIGFMSNPGDLAQMRSEKGRAGIAQRLFAAFSKYKKAYEAGSGSSAESSSGNASAANSGTSSGTYSGTSSESSSGAASEAVSNKVQENDGNSGGKKDGIQGNNDEPKNNTDKTGGKTGSETDSRTDSRIDSKAGAKTDIKTDIGTDSKANGNTGGRTDSKNDDYYSIQVLSVTKKLAAGAPDLKGRKDLQYIRTDNGLYKYHTGRYATWNDASRELAKVRKTFGGAFVIRIKDGRIVPR